MKKFLFTLFIFFLTLPAFAGNKVVVECLDDFSSQNPVDYFNVKVLEETEFENGIVFEKDAIFRAKVLEVIDQKRAKRDAYLIIRPVAYSSPQKNKVYKIKQTNWNAKVVGYKPFDVKKTAESAGVSAANFVVQGASTAFYFGKGFLHPEDDENRFKSGATEVFDNSPLSYIKEGKPMEVKKGDMLELIFYQSDEPKWKFWERM